VTRTSPAADPSRSIVEALDQFSGSKRQAATSIGISRQALDRRLIKMGHPRAPEPKRR
jgi:DNA-binding NtrC family response regulator